MQDQFHTFWIKKDPLGWMVYIKSDNYIVKTHYFKTYPAAKKMMKRWTELRGLIFGKSQIVEVFDNGKWISYNSNL